MALPKSTYPPNVASATNDHVPGERHVLNELELAMRWGLSVKTLQRWRSEGRGPRYLKLFKRVTYPIESVLDFERRSLHDTTSQRTHY